MIQNDKFVTQGVQRLIPYELQAVMWVLMDQVPKRDRDYLQVFELSKVRVGKEILQRIVHHQEMPHYCRSHRLMMTNPVQAKVYIIDDVTHCTMLLASEY